MTPSSGDTSGGLYLRGSGDGEITGSIPTMPGFLEKADAGTWTIGGSANANAITVSGGTLSLQKQASVFNNDQAKWTPDNISVANGATLAVGIGDSGAGYFDSTALDTFMDATHMGASTPTTGFNSGAVLGLDTTNATGGTFTYNGTVSDLGTAASTGLAKIGTGNLVLTANQSYTGGTAVRGGSLAIGNGGALPTLATSGISLANGANVTLNHSDDVTFDKSIAGSGSMTKAGTGTLTLNAPQKYDGATNVAAGTLKLVPTSTATPGLYEGLVSTTQGSPGDSTSPIPHTSVQLTARWGASNSTGDNTYPNWGNNTTWGYEGYFFAPQSGTYSFGKNFDDWGYLKLDDTVVIDNNTWNTELTTTLDLTQGWHAIDLRFGQGGGGVGGNAFNGFGIAWMAPGGSTWLQFADPGDASVLKVGGGTLLPTATNVAIASGATLDLNSASQMIAGLSDYAGNGGTVTNSGAADSTLTLNVGADSSFSGQITDGATNTVALVKTGSAVQTLSGTNTYTGTTTVSGGTLNLTGSIASSDLTVASGGALSGGGSAASLAIETGGQFTWSYGDGGDHTINVSGDLSLAAEWVVKLVDAGDDPLTNQQYELLSYGGTYTGDATFTDALANVTIDATEAPDWDIADLSISASGGHVYITGIGVAAPSGDVNGDGVVDAADYILMKQNWGNARTASAEAAACDLDNSGTVGIGDMDLLATAINNAGGAAVTPEPATLALLAFGGLAVIRRRRK